MRSTYKPDFPFSNFVLENYTTRNAMSCFGTIRLLSDYRARDPISVAWFDQVTLFSDFNRLFTFLGPGFSPYSSNAPFVY